LPDNSRGEKHDSVAENVPFLIVRQKIKTLRGRRRVISGRSLVSHWF
jgi:hypothetical protein